jgi:hypothetical protein
MFALHLIVLTFFTTLIVYSFLFSSALIIEGLEGGCSSAIANDPAILSKSNTNDIEELKKKMEDLKNMKSRVESIDMQTKQNTEGIKKLSDEAKNAGSDAVGGYKPDKDGSNLPKPSGLE